jgi:nitrogen regulatory protein PII
MKRIAASINPFKLKTVREALARAGPAGLAIAKVAGFGQLAGTARALS